MTADSHWGPNPWKALMAAGGCVTKAQATFPTFLASFWRSKTQNQEHSWTDEAAEMQTSTKILFIGGPEKKQGAHAESHLPSCWPEFIAANNVPGFWMLSSRIICSCVRQEQRHVYYVSFLLKLAFAVFIHYRLEWFVWCANEKIDTVMDLQQRHTAGTAHTQNLIDAKRNRSS